MNKLIIRITKNYGREAIYPVNEAAKVFASIAQTTTLSREVLKQAKSPGFEIEISNPTLEF